MLQNLTEQQRLLATTMSDISERCWHAGWMQNLEYALWHAVVNGPIKYGQGTVSREDIDALKWLSRAADCWIIFDGEAQEVAIGMTPWKAMFELENKSANQLFEGAL